MKYASKLRLVQLNSTKTSLLYGTDDIFLQTLFEYSRIFSRYKLIDSSVLNFMNSRVNNTIIVLIFACESTPMVDEKRLKIILTLLWPDELLLLSVSRLCVVAGMAVRESRAFNIFSIQLVSQFINLVNKSTFMINHCHVSDLIFHKKFEICKKYTRVYIFTRVLLLASIRRWLS